MSPTSLQTFRLPDLEAHCPYPLRQNAHCASAARASEAWLLSHGHTSLSARRRAAFLRLRGGELTAACYPDAPAPRLRDVADFLNFLFTLDDWSDEFGARDTCGLAECVMRAFDDPAGYKTRNAAGLLAKRYVCRIRDTYLVTVRSCGDFLGSFGERLRDNAGPRCNRRFMETMDLFFRAIEQQARDRARGDVPSFEEYIALRWDTSGCKPCFALIEYAAGIDLPDEVVSHPVIRALEEAANSSISWSNVSALLKLRDEADCCLSRMYAQDIFSYNVEQARGDSHNMITVVMRRDKLNLQEAVDSVGALCNASIDRFEQDRHRLPSWGPAIDCAVATYVQGLQDWMVGALHWSFDTARYLGDDGAAIKKHRIVTLLQKERRGRGMRWGMSTAAGESGSRWSLRHRLTCRGNTSFVFDEFSICSKNVS